MESKSQQTSLSAARAERAYLESRVLGAEPLELLVMLYEGLLKDVLAGQRCLEAKDWAGAQVALSKARGIVSYLIQCLRPDPEEISTRLRTLYAYCFDGIGRASLTQDPKPLAAVLPVIRELSGAWNALLDGKGGSTLQQAGEDRHGD